MCSRVSVWLYVPSGFLPIEVARPPPASMRLVGPAVRLGSMPPLSLSLKVRHSLDSSMTRDSSTRPHSVHTKSPCWWSSMMAVGTLHLSHIWENLVISCCEGAGAVAMARGEVYDEARAGRDESGRGRTSSPARATRDGGRRDER